MSIASESNYSGIGYDARKGDCCFFCENVSIFIEEKETVCVCKIIKSYVCHVGKCDKYKCDKYIRWSGKK